MRNAVLLEKICKLTPKMCATNFDVYLFPDRSVQDREIVIVIDEDGPDQGAAADRHRW